MLPWLEFWRGYFWKRPDRPSPCEPQVCTLDDLSVALAEHLESAQEVAAGAAKNVEDARRLNTALEAIKERKRQAGHLR
jgi:hypothetical protein